MKTPLKVGDRATGEYWHDGHYCRVIGVICKFGFNCTGIMRGLETYYCAPGSVKRLVKRKLREWKVTRSSCGKFYMDDFYEGLKPGETIIVREVPARKGEK